MAYPCLSNGNNSLTDDSTPAATLNNANSDGKKLMHKPITNMAVNSDGLASFDFMGGTSAIEAHQVSPTGDYVVLYDLGPIYIIRYANGTVRKLMKRK